MPTIEELDVEFEILEGRLVHLIDNTHIRSEQKSALQKKIRDDVEKWHTLLNTFKEQVDTPEDNREESFNEAAHALVSIRHSLSGRPLQNSSSSPEISESVQATTSKRRRDVFSLVDEDSPSQIAKHRRLLSQSGNAPPPNDSDGSPSQESVPQTDSSDASRPMTATSTPDEIEEEADAETTVKQSAQGKSGGNESRPQVKSSQTAKLSQQRQSTTTLKSRGQQSATILQKRPVTQDSPYPKPSLVQKRVAAKKSQSNPLISTLEFPCSTLSSLDLPDEALSAIKSARTVEITPDQWTYFKKNSVLPITQIQWKSLDKVMEQLQDELKEKGAILVQPSWKSIINSEKKPARLTGKTAGDSLPFKRFTFKKPDNRNPFVTIGHQVQRCRVKPSDSQEDPTPLTLNQFEYRMSDKSFGPLYANDVDPTSFQGLEKRFKISLQLEGLPGDGLSATKPLPGINQPYLYFGEEGSMFYLHMEDEMLHSLALVHAGQKIWRVFSPKYQHDLEDLVRANQNSNCTCAQFVRREYIYMDQKVASESGLTSTIFVQNPGQVMITQPGAYHQGFNSEKCVSEAVNYAWKWLPPSDDRLDVPQCPAKHEPYIKIDIESADLKRQINEWENVEGVKLLEARKLMSSQVRPAKQSLSISQAELARMEHFILAIGNFDVINQMIKPVPFKMPIMDGQDINGRKYLRSLYAQVKNASGLSSRIQMIQRYALFQLADHLFTVQRHRRQKRSHAKGMGKVKAPWASVVEEIALQIAEDGDLQTKAEVEKYLTTHAFQRKGRAYEALVAEFGASILWLLPDAEMMGDLRIDSFWLGEIFRHETTQGMFLGLMNSLRPQLRRLCQPDQPLGKLVADDMSNMQGIEKGFSFRFLDLGVKGKGDVLGIDLNISPTKGA